MDQTAIRIYFLTYGSLLGALFLFLAAWWFQWWRKEKTVFYRIDEPNLVSFASLLGFFYFLVALGSEFDGWWHAAVGRDDFWILPHLVIIVSLSCLTLATFFLLKKRELKNTRSLFFLTSCFLFEMGLYIGIALDDTAHNLFGQENISTPLVSLAPPHIFIGLCFLSIGFSLIGLVRAACRREPERSFLHALIGGSMVSFAMYQYQPFWPLGIYRISGAFGQFLIMVIIGIILSLLWRKETRFLFAGFALSMVVVVLEAIRMSGGGVDPNVPYPFVPFRIPSLFFYSSFLAAGIAIDMFRVWKSQVSEKQLALAGCIYGFTQAAFYYIPAKWWLDHKDIGFLLWPDVYFTIGFGLLGSTLGFLIPWWSAPVVSFFNRAIFPAESD